MACNAKGESKRSFWVNYPGIWSRDKGDVLARFVLELKCVKCGVSFEKSFEERRRTTVYSEGQLVRLPDSCPNQCGGEWFSVGREHSIRKFKRYR